MMILNSCKNAHILATILKKQATQNYCYIKNIFILFKNKKKIVDKIK